MKTQALELAGSFVCVGAIAVGLVSKKLRSPAFGIVASSGVTWAASSPWYSRRDSYKQGVQTQTDYSRRIHDFVSSLPELECSLIRKKLYDAIASPANWPTSEDKHHSKVKRSKDVSETQWTGLRDRINVQKRRAFVVGHEYNRVSIFWESATTATPVITCALSLASYGIVQFKPFVAATQLPAMVAVFGLVASTWCSYETQQFRHASFQFNQFGNTLHRLRTMVDAASIEAYDATYAGEREIDLRLITEQMNNFDHVLPITSAHLDSFQGRQKHHQTVPELYLNWFRLLPVWPK